MNTTEIVAEFGATTQKKNKDIYNQIVEDTNIEKFMTGVPNVDGDYQMAMAEMEDVLQGWQPAWTPKGELVFKANTLKTNRVKLDKDFNADEIEGGWLGYLVNEKKNRKDWPITKYLIQKVLDKVKENKDSIAVNGKYVAITANTPGTTLGVADGSLECIKKAVIATTSNVIVTGTLATNPYTKVRGFIRSMTAAQLKACNKTIFMSSDMVDAVYDDFFDTYDKKELKGIAGDDYGYFIPGTDKVKIVAIYGMGASERIWATPKWNWLKLYNLKEGLRNLELQASKRQLHLLGDFRMGYGFAFNEVLWHNDVE